MSVNPLSYWQDQLCYSIIFCSFVDYVYGAVPQSLPKRCTMFLTDLLKLLRKSTHNSVNPIFPIYQIRQKIQQQKNCFKLFKAELRDKKKKS